jgi:transcriptional regulator with PAS, ATPase and Fis domain
MKRLLALRETRARKISKECMAILLNYDYPGNIRELENILEHALIICQDNIVKPGHLPLSFKVERHRSISAEESAGPLTATRQASEKERIHEVLRRHHWNRGSSARELNIDRTTLWRKMKKYNLSP